jgi:hypothetical protein
VFLEIRRPFSVHFGRNLNVRPLRDAQEQTICYSPFSGKENMMAGRTVNSAAGAIARKLAERELTKICVPQASDKFERKPADIAALSRRWFFTAAGALIAVSPAFAEAPLRVRGVVTGIENGSITVMSPGKGIVTLKTGGDTSYAYVVPSSLDSIKVNDFVGSAVKGPPRSMVAVELAIIPDNMRAGRISYYGWDPLPDPTARHVSDTTWTSMTNGIVSAEKSGVAGRTLTVTYGGGGRSFRITVPPNAPVVRYVLADQSAVTIGCSVVIKTSPGERAGLVTVGRGVAPPM